MDTHVWLTGSRAIARRAAADRYEPEAVVSCHRRLRGPYTGVGQLVERLVPALLEACPDLVDRHVLALLTVSPDLRGVLTAAPETLTSLAIPAERTRFYSRLRTLRISHGLIDLLLEWAGREQRGRPITLVLDGVYEADPTDQEFTATALRRLDPSRVRLVLGAPAGTPPEPLAEAVARWTVEVAAPPAPATGGTARDYVWSEGTSDEPEQLAAYDRLTAGERAALHDDRAAELEALDQPSARLGALPYHRERGTDPAGAGAAALRCALDTCLDSGFYDATVELGERGRQLIDWAAEPKLYWIFTTKITTSLAALERAPEALALYDEARAQRIDGPAHMMAAYATAMMHTRHLPDEAKDHDAALRWINQAIAFADWMPDPDLGPFHAAFNRNGKALIEAHRGRPQEALALVEEAMGILDEHLEPQAHQLHRSVLRHNRAQVRMGLGDLDGALADLDYVVAADPYYTEYHFDRAGLLRRMGRPADALAEYDLALRDGLPFTEIHYNRADTLVELDEAERGVEEFHRVLELDPDHLDAAVNLAGLLEELGRPEEAADAVRTGLRRHPADAHLLCTLGLLHAAGGRTEEAHEAYTAALDADPDLVAAWTNRAVLAFDRGQPEAAVEDLTRALALDANPVLLLNRGLAHQQRGDRDAAAADLARALDTAADEVLHEEIRSALNRLQVGALPIAAE